MLPCRSSSWLQSRPCERLIANPQVSQLQTIATMQRARMKRTAPRHVCTTVDRTLFLWPWLFSLALFCFATGTQEADAQPYLAQCTARYDSIRRPSSSIKSTLNNLLLFQHFCHSARFAPILRQTDTMNPARQIHITTEVSTRRNPGQPVPSVSQGKKKSKGRPTSTS